MLEKALRGSRLYWLWVMFLLLLAGAAAGLYLYGWIADVELSNLSRDVAWGFFIANYTFMVGVAASAVMVVLPYYLHNQKEFGRITALGEFLAVGAVLTTLLFVMADVGQPTRALNMYLYPTPGSPFFWNTNILPGYMILNLIIAWFTLDAEQRGIAPARWVKWLILLSIPWAISIHTFTSFVYSGLVARPFWDTAILTPRFIASAFASGPALLVLLALAVKKFTGYDPGTKALEKVGLIVTYAMIVNVFLVVAEMWSALYSNVPAHVDHFRYLYVGLDGHAVLVPWMWVSAVLGVASIIMLIAPRVRHNQRLLAIACALVALSTWIDKGMGLVVGGFVPTPLAGITEYLPSAAEWFIAGGIYATALLVVTVLYKIAVGVKQEAAA